MAQRGTEANDVMADTELTGRARTGEETAFDELYRRHAAAAWQLAWVIDPSAARRTTTEAFARAFTALRAGRATDVAFATLVRNQVLNVATDADGSAEVAAADLGPVVEAFLALPITWRTAVWLTDGERLDRREVAAVVGLDDVGTSSLVERARAGWRERYLHLHFATSGNRNCSRAVGRMRALGEGPLADADRDALDRHLRLCEPCDERMATAAALGPTIAGLVPVVPVLLVDDVRAAWAAAVTTPSARTGLSPRTEKLLAGATAAVAALGIVGAAVVGTGRAETPAADGMTRVAAPIVTDVSAPVPLRLGAVAELAAPGALPVAERVGADDDVVALAAADGDAVPLAAAADPATPAVPPSGRPGTGNDGAGDGSIPNEGPGDDDPALPEGTVPTASVAVTVADVPVAVAVGDDPGVTAGPISVGAAPAPAPAGQPEVTVGGPLAPAQPVVDEVVAGL